MSVLFQAAAL